MEEAPLNPPLNLSDLPPVGSVSSACAVLDQVFGVEGWTMDVCYMSPAWHVATIAVISEEPRTRKAWANDPVQGPDIAFLRAYALLGGKVNLPKPMPTVSAPKPAMAGTRSAPPIAAAIPGVPYDGPKLWKEDAFPTVHPAHVPEPPTEPDWFKAPIGWYLKKQFADITWSHAIAQEIENPGEYGSPMSKLAWAVSLPPRDPKLKNKAAEWNAKAKAALIWCSKRQQQVPDYDEDNGGYQSEMVEGESVPF